MTARASQRGLRSPRIVIPHYLRIAAWGALAVMAFDLVMSLASLRFGVSYAWGLVGSTAIYLVVGMHATRHRGTASPIGNAVAAGVMVALVDATLGWAISWYVGPGRLATPLTPGVWFWGALMAMSFGAMFAALGGAVGRRFVAVACVMTCALPGCAQPGAAAGGTAEAPGATPGGRVLEFTGGHWFDGRAFERRTVFVAGGVLTFERPARVDSIIDLAGGFVIPPFGEAHNHNVEHSPRIGATVARYLRDGVFYVKNPNNLPRTRAPLTGVIDVPAGIDVAFANGGLTAPGGHPMPVVRRNLERGMWTTADGEGAFYFTVADTAELGRKWSAISGSGADFVKTYLLYSGPRDRERPLPGDAGWNGLDPLVLRAVVRRAHATGQRVSTHVETAADFHNAVVAGVDEISHLPGFRGDPAVELPEPGMYEIADEDAVQAAAAGIVVVTTAGGVRDLDPAGPDSARRRAFDNLHRRNLRLLHARGVKLAIGSDDYGDTSAGEADYLLRLGVVDALGLLKLWAEVTPQAIFPDRRVGCVRPGCEASFLVLRGNPVTDFGFTRAIVLRVKDGRVMQHVDPRESR